MLAMLGGFFGPLALLLAGVGLCGVTSYAVNLAVMAIVGTAAAFLPACRAAGIRPVDVPREG